MQAHAPCEVNLNAFESRFFNTCCSRFESVRTLRPRLASTCISNERPRLSASCLKVRPPVSSRLEKKTSSASTVTVPDSIFDRSRMSVMRFNRSVPAP